MRFFPFKGFTKDKGESKREKIRRQINAKGLRNATQHQHLERQGLHYSLTFKTLSSLGEIEDWLKLNFPDDYYFKMQGISDDFKVKKVHVRFALPEQREAFKEYLRKRHN